MIRDAKPADFPQFLELGKRICSRSPAYRDIEVDRESVLKTYGLCMNSALGFAKVNDNDGTLDAVLLGVADRLWWSRARYASDLIFYSEAPGAGLRLLRAFIDWAWSVPGVIEVTMGQSTGIEVERTARLYERAGLSRVGGLFHMKHQEVPLCRVS